MFTPSMVAAQQVRIKTSHHSSTPTFSPNQPRRALSAASSAAPAARSPARRALPRTVLPSPRCAAPIAATMAAAASQGAALESSAFHSSALRGHLQRIGIIARQQSSEAREGARGANNDNHGEVASLQHSPGSASPALAAAVAARCRAALVRVHLQTHALLAVGADAHISSVAAASACGGKVEAQQQGAGGQKR